MTVMITEMLNKYMMYDFKNGRVYNYARCLEDYDELRHVTDREKDWWLRWYSAAVGYHSEVGDCVREPDYNYRDVRRCNLFMNLSPVNIRI